MAVAGLTPRDFEAVRAIVKEVETKTSGEIVPLVVADAGDYRWVRYWMALLGLGLAVAAAEAWSFLRVWPLDANELLGFAGGGALLGALVSRVPAVARRVIGDAVLRRTVHRRALAEFVDQGCGNTRDRTGILVMVALFERRIEIVADRGIHARVIAAEGAGHWDAVTADFARAAGKGNAVEGLVDVVRRLGETLARHAPRLPGDENELPDELRTEDE